MQRQSLGSPSSKLQIHGGKDEKLEEEEKRKENEQEEEKKTEKLLRSSSRPEKFIHLIPVLMILCFLILYLASYDPSQKDSGYARDHERFFHTKDSSEIGRFFELEKSEVLAIHGHRSLQEVVGMRGRKSRPWNSNLHRKFGDI
ncbi:uncharacterized protein LOC143877078 [Tasmannia lanceolata]|uniref:uncharacterized protein LOC143877078 n=1 Tax=Tasmannia lanceolata TaxID=3420 RepID=UPI0040630078